MARSLFPVAGQFVCKNGAKGTSKHQVDQPVACATAPVSGFVYVADSGNSRVQVANFDGKFEFNFGEQGDENGHLNQPTGIAISCHAHDRKGQDTVYVVDSVNKRVSVFAADGKFLHHFKQTKFSTPLYIATDSHGYIYIVDGATAAIKVFDNTEHFLFSFGGPGTGDGQFGKDSETGDCVGGLAVDPAGRVFVADRYNNRIQVFNCQGQFLYSFNQLGDCEFKSPSFIAISQGGHLYISDSGNSRVMVSSMNGHLMNELGANGNQDGNFMLALGLCLSNDNRRLFVIDSEENRFQIFK